MYEPVVDAWKRYKQLFKAQWQSGDPRHDLSSEVVVRLEQLDRVLEHCRASIAATDVNPEARQRDMAWIRATQPRLASGEMTEREYIAGLTPMSVEHGRRLQQALADVQLFTEMFYVIAHRLREILNSPGPRRFHRLQEIKAHGIRDVRHLLIMHPEKRRPAADFSQNMVITDDGPVLKSLGVRVRGATPRVEADDDSLDKGLFVNAEAFLKELTTKIETAIHATLQHQGTQHT